MSDESTTSVDALTAVGSPNEPTDGHDHGTETESVGAKPSDVHRTETAVDGRTYRRGHDSNSGNGGDAHVDNSSERRIPETERSQHETDGGNDHSEQQKQDPSQFREWFTDTSAVLADADSARVDVYVRSMLPSPGAKKAQMTVLDNISSLCDETTIDDTTVHVWGERICLCDTCRDSDTGALMIDTVRELENWGRRYDASAEPFFGRTRQESSLVEDTYEGIVPPRVTAVFYVDGSLQGVFPSRFAGEPYSVSDFYRSMRSMTDPDRDDSPSERDRDATRQNRPTNR